MGAGLKISPDLWLACQPAAAFRIVEPGRCSVHADYLEAHAGGQRRRDAELFRWAEEK